MTRETGNPPHDAENFSVGSKDNEGNPELLKQKLVSEMASKTHEAWRAPRKKEDGTFEPRIKKTNDTVWSEKHGGAIEVDIANATFNELPDDWQAESKASAEIAITEIFKAVEGKLPLDESFIESASSVIHEEWLKRNGSWAPPEQNKPYNELSEKEKEKDRVIIRKAIEVYEQSKNKPK